MQKTLVITGAEWYYTHEFDTEGCEERAETPVLLPCVRRRSMNRSEYESRTEALVRPILDERGWELVDVEFVKEGSTWYLRAYIDKPGGITVDDCEVVSRALEAKLDSENFISESYILEVSSPGLGRAIKKDKDFARNEGKEIELRLYKAFEHRKEFSGVLKRWDETSVTIIDEDNRELEFARKDLALVREAFDW